MQNKVVEFLHLGLLDYQKALDYQEKLFKKTIDLKIKNLLNNKKESVYESFNTADQLYSLREYGTEISIGYSLKF